MVAAAAHSAVPLAKGRPGDDQRSSPTKAWVITHHKAWVITDHATWWRPTAGRGGGAQRRAVGGGPAW